MSTDLQETLQAAQSALRDIWQKEQEPLADALIRSRAALGIGPPLPKPPKQIDPLEDIDAWAREYHAQKLDKFNSEDKPHSSERELQRRKMEARLNSDKPWMSIGDDAPAAARYAAEIKYFESKPEHEHMRGGLYWLEKIPLAGRAFGWAYNRDVRKALERIEAGNEKPGDMRIVAQAQVAAARAAEREGIERYGDVMLSNAQFMAEFMATGGVGAGLGKAAATNAFARGASASSAKALMAATRFGTQVALMPSKFEEMERRRWQEGEGWGEAFSKAFTKDLIEVASENMGGAIARGLGKPFGAAWNRLPKKLRDSWAGKFLVSKGGMLPGEMTDDAVAELFRSGAHFDGFIGEYAEELAADLMTGATDYTMLLPDLEEGFGLPGKLVQGQGLGEAAELAGHLAPISVAFGFQQAEASREMQQKQASDAESRVRRIIERVSQGQQPYEQLPEQTNTTIHNPEEWATSPLTKPVARKFVEKTGVDPSRKEIADLAGVVEPTSAKQRREFRKAVAKSLEAADRAAQEAAEAAEAPETTSEPEIAERPSEAAPRPTEEIQQQEPIPAATENQNATPEVAERPFVAPIEDSPLGGSTFEVQQPDGSVQVLPGSAVVGGQTVQEIFEQQMAEVDAELQAPTVPPKSRNKVDAFGYTWRIALAQRSVPPKRSPGKKAPQPEVKQPWQMTYEELSSAVKPGTREELQKSRSVLAELFPEDDPRISATEIDDPWGIYRAIHRGDEIPRVPTVDLSLRHKSAIQKALSEGKPVPAEVLAGYPDIATTETTEEKAAPTKRTPGKKVTQGELFEQPKPVETPAVEAPKPKKRTPGKKPFGPELPGQAASVDNLDSLSPEDVAEIWSQTTGKEVKWAPSKTTMIQEIRAAEAAAPKQKKPTPGKKKPTEAPAIDFTEARATAERNAEGPLPGATEVEQAVEWANKNVGAKARLKAPSNSNERDVVTLAEQLGTKVAFVQTAKDSTFGGMRERKTNVVLIPSGLGSNALWHLVGHELAHKPGFAEKIAEIAPKEAKRFRDSYIDSLISARDAGNQQHYDYYMKNKNRDEMLMQEGAAELVGTFMSKKSFRNRIQQENITLWSTIRDAVLDFIGDFTPKGRAQKAALEELRAPAQTKKAPGKVKSDAKAVNYMTPNSLEEGPRIDLPRSKLAGRLRNWRGDIVGEVYREGKQYIVAQREGSKASGTKALPGYLNKSDLESHGTYRHGGKKEYQEFKVADPEVRLKGSRDRVGEDEEAGVIGFLGELSAADMAGMTLKKFKASMNKAEKAHFEYDVNRRIVDEDGMREYDQMLRDEVGNIYGDVADGIKKVRAEYTSENPDPDNLKGFDEIVENVPYIKNDYEAMEAIAGVGKAYTRLEAEEAVKDDWVERRQYEEDKAAGKVDDLTEETGDIAFGPPGRMYDLSEPVSSRTVDAIDELQSAGRLDAPQTALWKELKPILQKLGINPRLEARDEIVLDDGREAAGQYIQPSPMNTTGQSNNERTLFSRKALAQGNLRLSEVLLHEATHAATRRLVQYLDQEKFFYHTNEFKATPEQLRSVVGRLKEIIYYLNRSHQGTKASTITDPAELVAYAFTNEQIRRELAEIRIPRSTKYASLRGKTLFRSFIETIADLLGIKSKRAVTALEEVVGMSETIISNDYGLTNQDARFGPPSLPADYIPPDKRKAWEWPTKKINEAVKRARGVKKPTMKDYLVWAADNLAKAGTRRYLHLDSTKAKYHTLVYSMMGSLRESVDANIEKYARELARVVKDLNHEQALLFTHYLIAKNQRHAHLHDQRFVFRFESLDQVEDALAHFENQIAKDPAVKKALKSREEFRLRVVKALRSRGLLSDEALANDNYYHQAISEYVRFQTRFGPGGKMTISKQSFEKARKAGEGDWGEKYDYNTNYIEAEMAWTQAAAATMAKIDWMETIEKKFGLNKQLKEEASEINYLNAVGGESNMRKIEKLKRELQDLRDKVARRGGGKSWRRAEVAERKRLNKAVSALDPTHEHRLEMGKWKGVLEGYAADGLVRPLGRNENWFDYIQTVLDFSKDPKVRGAAGRFLKAKDARDKAMEKGAEENGYEWQTYRTLAKKYDGYSEYQPKEGQYLYTVLAPSQFLMEQAITGAMTEADIRKALKLDADSIKEHRAVGQYEPMILPDDIVLQFESMRKTAPMGAVGEAAKSVHRTLKEWVLHQPAAVFAYSLRNAFGDTSAVSQTGQLGIFKEAASSAETLFRYYFRDTTLDVPDELQVAIDLGVLGSSFTMGELDKLPTNWRKSFKAFEDAGYDFRKMPVDMVKLYFNKVSTIQAFRESLLRYGAYKYILKRMNAGKAVHYGGAIPAVVKNIQKELGNERAAAHVSKEMLGNYAELTVGGDFMRRWLYSFWAWKEISAKRLYRTTLNWGQYVKDVNASEGTPAAIKALSPLGGAWLVAFDAAVIIWNLLFGDGEDELPRQERNKSHITMPFRAPDGSILHLRNVSPTMDVLEWVGFNSHMANRELYLNGQAGAMDALETTFSDATNSFVQGVRPDLKTTIEFTMGRTLFPDVWNSRKTPRDHILAGLGSTAARDLYKSVKGRTFNTGERGRPNFWKRLAIGGVTNPHYGKLVDTLELKRKFLAKQGISDFPPSPFKPMREAAVYNNYPAFREARRRFLKEKTNPYASFRGSLTRLDPLDGTMSKETQEAFYEWLTPDQRQDLLATRDYANDLHMKMFIWWFKAAEEDDTPALQALWQDQFDKSVDARVEQIMAKIPLKREDRERQAKRKRKAIHDLKLMGVNKQMAAKFLARRQNRSTQSDYQKSLRTAAWNAAWRRYSD